jgi:hypothetical protein
VEAYLLAEANLSLVPTVWCLLDSLSDSLTDDPTAAPPLAMEKETHPHISGSVVLDWGDCHAGVAAASRCTAGTRSLGGQELIDYSKLPDCQIVEVGAPSDPRLGDRGAGGGGGVGLAALLAV